MATICEKYANVKPLDDFDWSLYEDGWNGKSLRVNKRVKTKDGGKVFCHEKYAQKLYPKYFGKNAADYVVAPKDMVAGDIIHIKDIALIGEDELLLSTASGGSAIVNLSKENRFFDIFNATKEDFKEQIFKTEEGRKRFIEQGFLAKMEKNGKASLYDGTLIKTEIEFKQQIPLGLDGNFYDGKIVGSNRGGYIVEVKGIKCFMPGSHATSNKITDFESLVGSKTEVMIMKHIDGKGFLVSRKMYLDAVREDMIDELREEFEKNPDKVYRGKVTGAKHFGVFVELNDYYTGLLHKTYIMPTDYELLKGTEEDPDGNARRNFPPTTEMSVKIYSISDDNKRIILTNIMDNEQREAIVAARVAEEEKAEAARREEERKQKELQEAQEKKQMAARAAKNFKGDVVSLEDLANL